MLLSRIANLRCQNCKTVQPVSMMFRTNPYSGWNKIDAVRCQDCSTLLYLTGTGRNRRFFTIAVPAILLALVIGCLAISPFNNLHAPSDGPNAGEPNFFGGLLLIIFFIVPTMYATSRFEEIAIEPEPDAS